MIQTMHVWDILLQRNPHLVLRCPMYMKRCYSSLYSVLEVSQTASKKEIKTAFYKLAQRYHPDVNPGNTSSHSKFLQINQAYSVLSNDLKRREYDQTIQYDSIFSNRQYGVPNKRPSTRVTKHDIRPEDWIQFKRPNNPYPHGSRIFDFDKHQDMHYDSANFTRADKRRMDQLHHELEMNRAAGRKGLRIMINLCLLATLLYFFAAGYMDFFFK